MTIFRDLTIVFFCVKITPTTKRKDKKMAETLNTPSALSQPIAQSGDKNTIPVTNDQSLGLMSQSTGFPPITSVRIADGGKAPRRADFNGAFNLLSQQHYFFQNGGTETFRQEVSDAIGGYPLGARLWYTNSEGMTVVLRSLIQNNTFNFNSNSSYIDGIHWEVDIQSGAPVGSLMPYAGTTPPDGWLICDGSEISRTSYSRLFAVIGTTYGAGDGNSSFNLPDYSGSRFLTKDSSKVVWTDGVVSFNGTNRSKSNVKISHYSPGEIFAASVVLADSYVGNNNNICVSQNNTRIDSMFSVYLETAETMLCIKY